MNLKELLGRKVTIVATNGRIFTGRITDYFWPDDNEDNVESIVMKTDSNQYIEFRAEDVQTAIS